MQTGQACDKIRNNRKCDKDGEEMIETEVIEVDLGGRVIKMQIVKNSEEVLIDAINDEETPVWVELWPPSLAIARWLWEGPSLAGKSVLELGAGLGLPGVVAGLKGGQVLQTDYIPEALRIARENAALNNVSGIRTAVADWRSFDISGTFDYIIGSDILYHPELNPYLKKIFQTNLRPGGTIVMGDPGRRESLAFVKSLADEGWHVTERFLKVKQGVFDYRIHVFRIRTPG
ncbi:MAG: methyltransferase [Firmicutes bacterium HGW-Firmicutes-8]|nr:MAG: methyltransferase [Firmicutes bacterium HGW-Firmicutes-8]